RIVPLAGPSRRRSFLFRFLVRSLAVCGFSGGRLLGPCLFDVVGTETRGNFGPGAGDGYRAAHRGRHVQAGRALAVVGRVALSAGSGSSRPRSGLWPRFFRGSSESTLAQAAWDGYLLPLFDPCPGSARPQGRLSSLGMGSSLMARLVGCRHRGVHDRPDRGVAYLLWVRTPIAKALERF